MTNDKAKDHRILKGDSKNGKILHQKAHKVKTQKTQSVDTK